MQSLFDYLGFADFPDGVDMTALRESAGSIAGEMFAASRNAVPDVPNSFVEYAAFAIRYADGSIGLSPQFTDLNSDSVNLTGPDAVNFLQTLEQGDAIIGIIHTQSNSALPSPMDATAFSRLVF